MTGPDARVPVWTHESTYKGRGPSSFVHRRRLQRLLSLFRSIDLPADAAVADIGCSNGFLLAVLWDEVFGGRVAHAHGFDHDESLIKLARTRHLPHTEFDRIDLNVVGDNHAGRYDLVYCLETLEHVGNFENAFENLYRMCKPGGLIVVSVPNERGLPGLVKYAGRRLLRSNPYGDFFENRGEAGYVLRLITGRPIHVYRTPPAPGWGPHLGFDWRRLENHVRREYVEKERLQFVRRMWAGMRFNVFFVYRRPPTRS